MKQAKLPAPTTDVERAQSDMDEFGYCLLESVLHQDELQAVRSRVLEQLEAENQQDLAIRLSDKKQLLRFLINKGRIFRNLLLNEKVHAVVSHVLGNTYLLSSYHAHFAHPGTSTNFHTDQFWMPPPTTESRKTLIRPGSITREGDRGRGVFHEQLLQNKSISPAVTCNVMWMIDEFTEANGATIVVPGSHLSGREPDNAADDDANWVAAVGRAGTVCIFEGRTWHSTGKNETDSTRIGINTNFCAPQFRPQDNFLFGTRPEALIDAPDKLLELLGFFPWQGYGAYEGVSRITPGRYALGEMKPQ